MTQIDSRTAMLATALVALSGCAPRDNSITYLRSDSYTFSRTDRRVIEDIIDATAIEVRRLLPALPRKLEITVRPGSEVIQEIGATAAAVPPVGVVWTLDPARAGGVVQIAKAHLRATLFHEFHHLVRGIDARPPYSIVDTAVTEGMATAFERDFAGATYPWAQYPKADVEGRWPEMDRFQGGDPLGRSGGREIRPIFCRPCVDVYGPDSVCEVTVLSALSAVLV